MAQASLLCSHPRMYLFEPTVIPTRGAICLFTRRVFLYSITAILISRFLLALQEANRDVVRVDPGDPLYSSRNYDDDIPSFISSIGAFIDPNLPAPRDEDLEWHLDSHSGEQEPGIQNDSIDAVAAESRSAGGSLSQA